MQRVRRGIERMCAPLRRRFTKEDLPQSARTDEEEEALVFLTSLNVASYQTPAPRAATEEEVLRAAWANLAVEEKDLTFEEARRLLAAT